MHRTLLYCALATALCSVSAVADSTETTTKEILTLERKALDGWMSGNPDALLGAMDPEITYYHVIVGRRLDGLPAVTALFEGYRGRPLFDSYEIADPKVQVTGDTAVLSYVLVRHVGSLTDRWSATQVYIRRKDGWRVIHSHWSDVRMAGQ